MMNHYLVMGSYLGHELPSALQTGGGIDRALGQIGLRVELLRALQRLPGAQQRFALVQHCLGRLSLHLPAE